VRLVGGTVLDDAANEDTRGSRRACGIAEIEPEPAVGSPAPAKRLARREEERTASKGTTERKRVSHVQLHESATGRLSLLRSGSKRS
jgi:hypothetical protein